MPSMIRSLIALALAVMPAIATADAVFRWQFDNYSSPVPGFDQARFTDDPIARGFFPQVIRISDAAFAADLAYRYSRRDPPSGFNTVNNGVLGIGVSAPFDSTCAAADPSCASRPVLSLFGGVVTNSSSQVLFGGNIALPAPLAPSETDFALCVASSPTTSTFCSRSGALANFAVNLDSDANGLWRGQFFAAVGNGSLSADFTGRYVLESVPEPASALSVLLGLMVLAGLRVAAISHVSRAPQ